MEPIKIKGLNLESEKKEGVDLTPPGPETVDEVLSKDEKNTESNEGKVFQEIPDRELTIQEDLTSILKRVEALDRTDNTIKAIGKLQGAIELLKD